MQRRSAQLTFRRCRFTANTSQGVVVIYRLFLNGPFRERNYNNATRTKTRFITFSKGDEHRTDKCRFHEHRLLVILVTIAITTSDLHFSREITFPVGECKFHSLGTESAEFKKTGGRCIARNGIIYMPPCIITVSTSSTTHGLFKRCTESIIQAFMRPCAVAPCSV